jgi:hypothetical protein
MRNNLLVLLQRIEPEIIDNLARVARTINIAAPNAEAVEHLRQGVSSILGQPTMVGSPEFNEVLGACREAAEFRENLFSIRQAVLPSKTCRQLNFDEEDVPMTPTRKRKSIISA